MGWGVGERVTTLDCVIREGLHRRNIWAGMGMRRNQKWAENKGLGGKDKLGMYVK